MIGPSKYKDKFKQAVEAAGDGFLLTGRCMLVERVEVEMKTQSGLYMASGAGQRNGVEDNKPFFVYVLAVGAGQYDPETGEDVDIVTAEPGDIIMVGRNSVKWFSTLGATSLELNSVGLADEAETQMRWRGPEALERWLKALN